MSAVRPKYVMVGPADVERYGAAAAVVLAHIRYRCETDGPGRIEVADDRRWWRVSLSDLAHEVGMSQKSLRTALAKLVPNVVAANQFPPLENQTLAYCVQAPHRPVADSGTVQNTSDQPVADSGKGPCPNGQGTAPKRASALYIETLETKETKNASRSSSGRRSRRSERIGAANTSDNADNGTSEHMETPTAGEKPMKRYAPSPDQSLFPGPDQSLLPGMLVSVPKPKAPEHDHLPATVTETAPAKPSRSERATRSPDGWMPPRAVIAQMREECPHIDQEYEFRKFCDYWRGATGAKARKVDWAATYRNWICRAAEQTSRNGQRLATSDLRVMEARALKAKFRDRSREALP